MHLLRYAFDEAAASLWRGRRSGLLSTATIAIALFVLGAFLVVTSNLERLAEEWSGAAELSVYLDDDIGGADRAAIERDLRSDPAVADVEFVAKDQALETVQGDVSGPGLDPGRSGGEPAAGVPGRPAQVLLGSRDLRWMRWWNGCGRRRVFPTSATTRSGWTGSSAASGCSGLSASRSAVP